jgi:putative heme-binding domain-containing protein
VVFGLAAAAGFVGTGFYLVADRPAGAGAAIVSQAPLPSPRPVLRSPAETMAAVLAREVRFAAAAAGATSEFQVVRENSVPVGGYVASDLTPVINRALRGGRDFERGKRIYESAGCAVCHRFGGGTQSIGPDLTGVGGRVGVAEILESILEPSASISDLYALKVVHTRDARALTGKLVSSTETEIALVPNYSIDPQTRTATWPVATAVKIRTADILTIENAAVSLMPAGLINGLKQDEIADLIALLVSGGDSANRMFRPAAATP